MSLYLGTRSDTYLCQETLYRSESCKTKLRNTAACGPPGMSTQDHQACRRRYWCFSTAIRPPPSCCPLHFLHIFCLSVIIGMPNRSCIRELRTNQCFVCNFLFSAKAQCLSCFRRHILSCFRRHIRNMLTTFQVVCNSYSEVFCGLNLFQCLLMQ